MGVSGWTSQQAVGRTSMQGKSLKGGRLTSHGFGRPLGGILTVVVVVVCRWWVEVARWRRSTKRVICSRCES